MNQTLQIKLTGLELPVYPLPYLKETLPMAHQWQVYQAVQEALAGSRSLCIFNLSPTGAGKTMAAFAPLLLSPDMAFKAIGVYPTNDLLRDQERALQAMLNRQGLPQEQLLLLDGERLLELRRELEKRSNLEVLGQVLGHWSRLVLTNPDILFLLFYRLYPQPRRTALGQQLMQRLFSEYQLLVFDEFHLYNAKQLNDVALLVGSISQLAASPHVFIFSSATPVSQFQAMLASLAIPTVEINGLERAGPAPFGCSSGWFTGDEDTGTLPLPAGQRQVLQPVELYIQPANLLNWEGLEGIIAAYPLLEQYQKRYPEARVLFVLDSVYEARALADYLHEHKGIDRQDIGEVHGFMDRRGRQEGLARPYTVGTSTIEVGIDFVGAARKDVLIFEARSASQFLQRLGRLGRGVAVDGAPVPLAIALVPPYVAAYISERMETGAVSGAVLGRQELQCLVREAYLEHHSFNGFIKQYGPLVAWHLYSELLAQQLSDTAGSLQEKMEWLLERLYGLRGQDVKALYQHYRQDGRLFPLLTFRGSNFLERLLPDRQPLQLLAAVYDTTDQARGFFPFKFYHLPFLLARCRGQLLTAASFQQLFQKFRQHLPAAWEQAAEHFAARLEREEPVAYWQVDGLLVQRRRVYFDLPPRYCPPARRGQVVRLKGLCVYTDPPDLDLEELNDQLADMWAVAWVSTVPRSQLLADYRLPPLMRLYDLTWERRNTARPFAIAFDLEAFFMSTLSTAAEVFIV
ncbi:MAG: type I-D CRISPR-associated helicase Cas3' [Bacillota bacterium]